MTISVEDLAAQAIGLSAEDRSRLADVLLASLPAETDAEAEAAWDEEIKRRIDQVNSGTALVVSAEEVHEAARKIYQR